MFNISCNILATFLYFITQFYTNSYTAKRLVFASLSNFYSEVIQVKGMQDNSNNLPSFKFDKEKQMSLELKRWSAVSRPLKPQKCYEKPKSRGDNKSNLC